MSTTARDTLLAIYLDYINNYISAACYGEHHGLTEGEAVALIDLARTVASHAHPGS